MPKNLKKNSNQAMAKDKQILLTTETNSYKNTLLHEAILSGDSTKAMRLIKLDMHPEPKGTIINKRAWGNTPLNLALKLGLFDVAEAIISHPQCDINIEDELGMRPIHYAALFRNEKLLKILIEKNPKVRVNYDTQKWKQLKQGGGFMHLNKKTAKNNYIARTTAAKLYSADMEVCKAEGFIADKQGFTPTLSVYPGITLMSSELLFHMKPICQNLKIKSDFPKDTGRSGDYFRTQFNHGYPSLREYRNAISVNASILESLRKLEELQEYEDKHQAEHYSQAESSRGSTFDAASSSVARSQAQNISTNVTDSVGVASPTILQESSEESTIIFSGMNTGILNRSSFFNTASNVASTIQYAASAVTPDDFSVSSLARSLGNFVLGRNIF